MFFLKLSDSAYNTQTVFFFTILSFDHYLTAA